MLCKALKKCAAAALDFALPPLCVNCGGPTDAAQALCHECWKKIRFISPPHCSCCGMPFDFDAGEGSLCGSCMNEPPKYDKARSVIVYDDFSRGMILGMKHSDRLHVVPAMASWMIRAGKEILADSDVTVPVPLHRSRLFARRYNQSALLALEIKKQTGKACCVDALLRVRATPGQGRMNHKQRRENIFGAIRANPRRLEEIKGKNVVLIDDVMTSGATADECSKILKKAGAGAVSVITLALARGNKA